MTSFFTAHLHRTSYSGALLFNAAAFVLPALYSTLVKLWVADMDSSMVVTTDVYAYIGVIAEVLNEGLPPASWLMIGDRASRCLDEGLDLAHTLILFQSVLGLIMSIGFLAGAARFADVFVPVEVRAASVTYVRISAFFSVQFGARDGRGGGDARTRHTGRASYDQQRQGQPQHCAGPFGDLALPRGPLPGDGQHAGRCAAGVQPGGGVCRPSLLSSRTQAAGKAAGGPGPTRQPAGRRLSPNDDIYREGQHETVADYNDDPLLVGPENTLPRSVLLPNVHHLTVLLRPGLVAMLESAVRNILYLWLVSTIVALGTTYATAWGIFNTIRWGLVMVPVQAL